MSFERSYNVDFAKTLIGHSPQEREAHLDQQLEKARRRFLELDDACREMTGGFTAVLNGLKMAFPEQIDLDDPNFDGTPERMARAMLEVCSGLGVSDQEILSRRFPLGQYDEMIMLKDIEYTSICAHHFFPFTGVAHIGYLVEPEELGPACVVGVSKLARIVDAYARRPQLQERLCLQIKEAIKREIAPAGIIVVVEGKHGCLACRGAMKTGANMITSALDGTFQRSHKLRDEFLGLLRKGTVG